MSLLNFKNILNKPQKEHEVGGLLDNLSIGYDYDDLLIRPKLSHIESRQDINISTELFPSITFDLPVIAAPMSTICETKMCIRMAQIGGLGILHRFAATEDLERLIIEIAKEVPQEKVAFAVGIRDEDFDLLEKMSPHAGIVCVDTNIGHHVKTIGMIKHIKDKYPHLKIIAGNVSTYEGSYDLCEAGADCIRATNGGGSACITWSVTGTGVPPATALYECCQAAAQFKNKTVIADGGLKDAGSMVKAIALGAHACMVGGLIAGSSWCPESAFFEENDLFKAKYYGMASEEAQRVRGGVKPGTAAEGISQTIQVKGKTDKIVNRLAGGIKSGCSFLDAANLEELRKNAETRFVLRSSRK